MSFRAKGKIKERTIKKRGFDRISFVAMVFFILGGLIFWRLFCLQVLNYKYYKSLALSIHQLIKEIGPKRGEIFVADSGNDSGLHSIATNKDLYLVYAIPSLIKDPQEAVNALAPLLNISEKSLLEKLSKKDDPYEPIKHFIEEADLTKIKKLDIKGIDFVPESARFYPDKNLFSHILGFFGFKGDSMVGRYGLEEYFEEALSGKKGVIVAEKDAKGGMIPVSDSLIQTLQDGADLILTLDYSIQFIACSELKAGVEKYEADSGTVVVINPKTGAILALCNYPDYDPNLYNQVKNINTFLNPAISYNFEPGSIFKTITFAAALDSNKVDPQTTYEDKGVVKIGEYAIRNSDLKAHGVQTMTEVLDKSLNTGAVFAVRKTGTDIFRRYVADFGFGRLTGIELPGEIKGNISSLDKKGEIYAATASFGQGIAVTPLQITNAFAAIAHQGALMKPYLVDKIIYKDGQEMTTEPKIVQQVISSQTASVLSAMLISAVENGFGQKARVDGYYIAGKTGTAQVPNPNQRGYSDETIHTFCGFGPVSDPKFAMLVKLDNVKTVKHGADSATPVFGKIAKFILSYYKVAPER